MTVEDPIEYYIDGIGQTQVNTKVEMTFARAGCVRSSARTRTSSWSARFAISKRRRSPFRASLTGPPSCCRHCTRTLPFGAVTRPARHGCRTVPALVEPDRRAGTAPRARTGRRYPGRLSGRATTSAVRSTSPPMRTSRCNRPGEDAGTGFRGRTGIYELVPVDDTMRTMIHDGASEHQLEKHARTLSPSIRDDGPHEGAERRHDTRGSSQGHSGRLSDIGETTARRAGERMTAPRRATKG